MSKEVEADFELLKEFVGNYSLERSFTDADFVRKLSRLHAHYFAFLVFTAEMGYQQNWSKAVTSTSSTQPHTPFEIHVTECSSELGTALFLWIHGSYKAAELVLRSSIENYFKAVASTIDPKITLNRRPKNIREKAKQVPFFADSGNSPYLDTLKDSYDDLCKTVHTAGVTHTQRIECLSHFPGYDQAEAQKTCDHYVTVARTMLTALCLWYQNVTVNMNFRNKNAVFPVLPVEVRRSISEGL